MQNIIIFYNKKVSMDYYSTTAIPLKFNLLNYHWNSTIFHLLDSYNLLYNARSWFLPYDWLLQLANTQDFWLNYDDCMW
jgi:hypothetical protein